MPNKEPIRQFVRIIFSGEVGKWGNGEMGKWGNGEMGKWGNGEIQLKP
jgi:hypothetical protein